MFSACVGHYVYHNVYLSLPLSLFLQSFFLTCCVSVTEKTDDNDHEWVEMPWNEAKANESE